MTVRNTIALAFLSVILVLQPILPMLEYYTFKSYIVENLCINRDKPESCCEGKCFLEKQIEESQSDMPADKQSTSTVKSSRVEYFCSTPWLRLAAPVYAISPKDSGYLNSNYSLELCHTIFHPPKIAFVFSGSFSPSC